MLDQIALDWRFLEHPGSPIGSGASGTLTMIFSSPDGDGFWLGLVLAIHAGPAHGIDLKTDCFFTAGQLTEFSGHLQELWAGALERASLYDEDHTCCLCFEMQDRGRGTICLNCDFFYPEFGGPNLASGDAVLKDAPTEEVGLLAKSAARLVVADAKLDAEQFQTFRDSFVTAIRTWVE